MNETSGTFEGKEANALETGRARFLRIPISTQLILEVCVIILVTVLVLSWSVLSRQKKLLYAESVQKGKISLNYFAASSALPILADDKLSLANMIRDLPQVEGLVYAAITDRDGMVLAHTDYTRIGKPLAELPGAEAPQQEGLITLVNFRGPSDEAMIDAARDIRFKNTKLGEAHVGISLAFIADATRLATIRIIILSGVIALLALPVAVLLSMRLTRPIAKLAQATQEIGRGNYQHRTNIRRNDELGDLGKAFNYMAEELWRKNLMRESFGRYVSPEVVEMILSKPEQTWLEGASAEASVLLADVRGFTAYTESHDAKLVVAQLNEYFEIATQAIVRRGGYVDKFMGDAVMAVFGVPVHQADHPDRALTAAVEMQRELAKAAKRGNNPLLGRVGVSLVTGTVLSGNLGSSDKMEYTVIGGCVNLAARLNGFAGPGEIIVDREMYERIADRVSCREMEPQMVKGKSQPVEMFCILEHGGDLQGELDDPSPGESTA